MKRSFKCIGWKVGVCLYVSFRLQHMLACQQVGLCGTGIAVKLEYTKTCWWKVGWNCREENIITCLGMGHTALNHTLYKSGKNPAETYTHCSQPETAESYFRLTNTKHREIYFSHEVRQNIITYHHQVLGKTAGKTYSHIITFLKEVAD